MSDQTTEIRACLKELMIEKDQLEAQIEALNSGNQLSSNDQLVDSEGFPRADIDVHSIRIARNNMAQVQNDHVKCMKSIERSLQELHAMTKNQTKSAVKTSTEQSTDQSIKQSISESTQKLDKLDIKSNQASTSQSTSQQSINQSISQAPDQPITPRYSIVDSFFLVDAVTIDSPAHQSGLRVGDRVVSFGSLTKSTQSKQAMREIVQSSVGRPLHVTVLREFTQVVQLSLTPQTWNGPGLLGCHLQDV